MRARTRGCGTTVGGPDQLRQRVAFALSQIMVVSQSGPSSKLPWAGQLLRMLAQNAFGDFRELMET